MCAILLSIHPKYVQRIMCGDKIYEYRKSKCKMEVHKILIYSTSPIMKVVGEADVESILEGNPTEIWEKTKRKSGVKKNFFDKYYENKSQAIAYKLCNVREFDEPKTLNDYGVRNAPQSFKYITIE